MLTSLLFRRKTGFTLIEVVVVMAIISILMGIVSVTLSAARLKTEAVQALTDLQKIALYIETYKANNGTYPLSCGTGGSWASRDANPWGCGLGSCWITQFSGEGWCPLPYNLYPPPSGSATARSQYIYRTDAAGSNYKLIYHEPVSLAVPAQFIDPQRPTSAFGIWSTGGAGY
ncbi:MAG: prepilin-type N-terminal cleavage/methylation domain-containing protein [Candidatus Moraniibacteriota bacterium]|nr:MAG: prepilin-type N-terminal cleavage/methylation domain-containing protein [Candidatus Moranbacteria bacterium]